MITIPNSQIFPDANYELGDPALQIGSWSTQIHTLSVTAIDCGTYSVVWRYSQTGTLSTFTNFVADDGVNFAANQSTKTLTKV